MSDVVYRIKNKDGLYSTGGLKPKFVRKNGKVWLSLTALKSHLRQFSPKYRKHNFSNDEYNGVYEKFQKRNPIPKDWVIVQMEETKEVGECWKVFGVEF